MRSRRAVLGAALGGAAAVAASAVIRPLDVEAIDGASALLGTPNESVTVTGFANLSAGAVSVTGTHTGSGTGVVGQSFQGTGLKGISTDTTPSAFPDGSYRTGVIGAAGDTTNIGLNTDETGVFGFADISSNSSGVVGYAPTGWGVIGFGTVGVVGLGSVGIFGNVDATGTAVYGFTGNATAPLPPPGVGVYARAASTSQTALSVVGKAKFSRSGRTSFGSTATSKTITMTGVTASSYVVATMQMNVSGLYVRCVVCASGSFKIYLSKAAGKTAYVGFLVIN